MRTLGIGLAALVLAACGSSSAPIAPEHFEASFERAFCEAEARCSAVSGVDSCVTGDNIDFGRKVTSVAAGRLGYDAAAAGRCVEAMAARGCEIVDGWAWPPECDGVFHGEVSTGGICFDSSDCASGACQQQSTCHDACCGGSCGAPLALESDCRTGDTCPAGTVCFPSSPAGIAYHCEAPHGVGDTCYRQFSWCTQGLYCTSTLGVNNEISAGVCAVPAEHGAACDADHAGYSCRRLDDYCDPGSRTCVTRLPVGAACTLFPTDPILPTESACIEAARCVKGSCVAYGTSGSACTESGDCAFGYDCVGSTCVPYPADPVCP